MLQLLSSVSYFANHFKRFDTHYPISFQNLNMQKAIARFDWSINRAEEL